MNCRKPFLYSMLMIPALTIIGSVAGISLSTNAACAQTPTWDGEPFFMEASGVSNCGGARVDDDAKKRCIDKARETNLSFEGYRWRNAQREDWQEWNGSRKCKYRATVICTFGPPR